MLQFHLIAICSRIKAEQAPAKSTFFFFSFCMQPWRELSVEWNEIYRDIFQKFSFSRTLYSPPSSASRVLTLRQRSINLSHQFETNTTTAGWWKHYRHSIVQYRALKYIITLINLFYVLPAIVPDYILRMETTSMVHFLRQESSPQGKIKVSKLNPSKEGESLRPSNWQLR